MSNFFLADRIKETSRVQGTGNISLDGPVSSFSAFKDFYASGDAVFYAITDNVQYEIGSGIFKKDGSTDSVTRNPFRSSKINVGPWYINGTSNSGPTNGNTGYFYPLWLSRSSAEKGVGFSTGPFSSVSGINFNGYPGITFYHIAEHAALGVASLAASGSDYAASGTPVSFGVGVKEVFVTYPGKTSVYNGFGISNNVKEPKQSGIAFWENEQILNYTSNLVWNNSNGFLGINKTPGYSIDVGGSLPNSIIRASGFVDGGSGVLFAGGQFTDTLDTASGGRQFEPFRRNRKGSSAQGVIELSGVVSQIIDFVDQQVATVFAGPISGVCNPCPEDAPSFRRLVASDLPTVTELKNAWSMVIQDNLGTDNQSANISPNIFVQGMIPIYRASGIITYDSGILFDRINNRLLVGGNASLPEDAPAYTLDVKGESTISAASGYFNQLIFKDDLIRIGDGNNNTNLGNLSDNYYTVSIGKSASVGASGTFDSIFVGRNAGENVASSSGVVAVGLKALQNSNSTNHTVAIGTEAGAGAKNSNSLVFVGRNAGFSSSGLNNVVAIGDYSASGMRSSTSVVAIGLDSASVASGLSNVVAIGQNSVKGSSGIYSSYLIGDASASGSFNLNEIVAIGKDVVGETSLLSSSVAVGKNALRYARNSSDVVAIGRDVGLSGLVLTNSIAIGTKSAQNASGVHNVYLGSNAGISVSGNENIEIIASGSSSSFLTHQASGKINVGNTIVGDIYKGRVTVGSPENVNPSATLYVKPKFADDAAFIIQHQGSGSSTPFFQMQSGDGTTFYQITNSGSVITSGYMAPSGGIFLPHNNKPMLNSGLGGYMLWNDGGSLTWNGGAVGLTALSAASGLVYANSKIILDPDGSGSIRQLNFPSGIIVIDSFALNRSNPSFRDINAGPGSVLIGSGAGFGSDLVKDATIINIGKGAGQVIFGTPAGGSVVDSICIGSYAGSISGNAMVSGADSISIGDRSFPQGNNSVSIGFMAGRVDTYLNPRLAGNINIGSNAGRSGVNIAGSNINIGSQAAFAGSGHYLNVSIGYDAARTASGCFSMVSVGANALDGNSIGVTSGVCVGYNAGFRSYDSNRLTAIGVNAAYMSSGIHGCVLVGNNVGFSGSLSNNAVMIGTQAGAYSYDCDHSVFIGVYAGRNASGIKNSISFQSNTGIDFYWANPTGQPNLLDINGCIQGHIPDVGASLHIGRKLDPHNTAGAATITATGILNSALNLTPTVQTRSALKLWLYPETTAVSNQSKNLFETQYRSVGASTAPYANPNPIINEYGALRLPLASGLMDTGAAAELIGNSNQIIPKGEGVVALYEIPHLGTNNASGIAVCLGSTATGFTWYKFDAITTF